MKKIIIASALTLFLLPILIVGVFENVFQEQSANGDESFKMLMNQYVFDNKHLPDISKITACAVEQDDYSYCLDKSDNYLYEDDIKAMLDEAMHVESFEGLLPSELFNHTYTIPLKNATYNKSSGFGFRFDPLSGDISFHDAVDLAATQGTKVYSFYEGEVIDHGYDDVKGNYINVLHRVFDEEQVNCRYEEYYDGEGKLIYEEYVCDTILLYEYYLETQYLHLENTYVRTGQIVQTGSRIGTVGSTGYSTGAHLHFAILFENKFLNPYAFIEF